jgi:hypothetical protein
MVGPFARAFGRLEFASWLDNHRRRGRRVIPAKDRALPICTRPSWPVRGALWRTFGRVVLYRELAFLQLFTQDDEAGGYGRNAICKVRQDHDRLGSGQMRSHRRVARVAPTEAARD